MKKLFAVFLVIAIAVFASIVSLLKPWVMSGLPQASFIGMTNGAPSTFSSTLQGHHANFIREWLKAGTNIALFNVTNYQTRSIILYPYVGFFSPTNLTQQRYGSVLQNAPDAYGIFLGPGEAAILEVPILPGEEPVAVRFGYSPDYYHFISRSKEEVREIIANRKRPDFHLEWFFSETIEP